MENNTTVRIQLDIMAQKMINQYMINNEQIEKEIEVGIKRAFENINLEREIEIAVSKCIKDAIQSSSDWGKIRDIVTKKTDDIINQYVEASINKFKSDFKSITNGE